MCIDQKTEIWQSVKIYGLIEKLKILSTFRSEAGFQSIKFLQLDHSQLFHFIKEY